MGVRDGRDSPRSQQRGLLLFFTDADTGWVVGWKGIIFHTKDGGKTWKPQKSGTKLF